MDDSATARHGWPGSSEGPETRTGSEPDAAAQNAIVPLPMAGELEVVQPAVPQLSARVDAEGKYKTGQYRQDPKAARHSSYRPYEK